MEDISQKDPMILIKNHHDGTMYLKRYIILLLFLNTILLVVVVFLAWPKIVGNVDAPPEMPPIETKDSRSIIPSEVRMIERKLTDIEDKIDEFDATQQFTVDMSASLQAMTSVFVQWCKLAFSLSFLISFVTLVKPAQTVSIWRQMRRNTDYPLGWKILELLLGLSVIFGGVFIYSGHLHNAFEMWYGQALPYIITLAAAAVMYKITVQGSKNALRKYIGILGILAVIIVGFVWIKPHDMNFLSQGFYTERVQHMLDELLFSTQTYLILLLSFLLVYQFYRLRYLLVPRSD